MATLEFGTDGYRGEFDMSMETGINAATFEKLTNHFASYLHEVSGQAPTIIVGRDTRDSGLALSQAVATGACQAGAEVWDLGIAPTPVIASLAKAHHCAAVAVTSSHNPANTNGYKPFLRGGDKPNRTVVDKLSTYYDIGTQIIHAAPGRITPRPELIDEYLSHVIEELGGSDVLGGFSLAVDGANGATYDLAPRLYKGLGAEVIEFACACIGERINQNCGAASLAGARDFLASRPERHSPNFLGLLAHDGDGDRVLGLDADGNKVDGNHWMRELAEGQVGIVGTQYTNSALRRAVREMNVEFHECENGDSYVTATLKELSEQTGRHYRRGGEFTGHLIDLDHLSSGDGMYMGGWLAVRAVLAGTNFAGIRSNLVLHPERMESVHLNGHGSADEVLSSAKVVDAIAAAEDFLGERGRVIVRASGTEPLIRYFAEAEDPESLDKAMEIMLAAVA